MLKPEKCDLFRKSVTFLGHTVDENGISTDPAKISALTKRPRPRSVEDVRSFLGLAGYYRDHIPNYADIAAPMTELTKKSKEWQWLEEEEESYRGLIDALTGDTPGRGSRRMDSRH